VSVEDRKTQEKFTCVQGGFTANADFVAAVNIKEAGLALLACAYPSGDVSPSWQEPTEGIPAWASFSCGLESLKRLDRSI